MAKGRVCLFWSIALVALCGFFFPAGAAAKPGTFVAMEELERQERQSAKPDIPPRLGFKYEQDRGSDPFALIIEEDGQAKAGQAAPPAAKPLPNLVVQGLIWGGAFPQAIINNKVVKEGDIIEGARLLKVEKAGVSLLFEGREFTLSPAAAGSPPKSLPRKQDPEGGYYGA
jgi:hypothetical protein